MKTFIAKTIGEDSKNLGLIKAADLMSAIDYTLSDPNMKNRIIELIPIEKASEQDRIEAESISKTR